jgi:hypothetical protein
MTNCENINANREKYVQSHHITNTNYYNNSYEKKKDSEHTNIPKTRRKSKDLDSEIPKTRRKPIAQNKITKININICSFRFMRVITKNIRLLPFFKYFGSSKIVPV